MLFSFNSRFNHKYYYNIFSFLPTFASLQKKVINMRIIWLAQCEISLGDPASSLHAPLYCHTLMVHRICIKSHFPDAGLVPTNPFAAAITTSEEVMKKRERRRCLSILSPFHTSSSAAWPLKTNNDERTRCTACLLTHPVIACIWNSQRTFGRKRYGPCG